MATKAQQKGAPRKILRVGVIQNGRIIEERLVRERVTVTVGRSLKNTVVLASDGVPASYPLFDVVKGEYHLRFTNRMRGRVAFGDGVVDLATARESGRGTQTKDGWLLPLGTEARGKVAVGDVTLLFQFVDAPPLRTLPVLPANMRGGILYFLRNVAGLTGPFMLALLMSLLIQVGFLLYLRFMVPPPPRGAGDGMLNERWTRFLEQQERQEVEVVEMDLEADLNEIVEVEDTAVEEQASAAPSEESSSNRSRDEVRQAAEQRVQQMSPFAALVGSDGGMNLGIAVDDRMSAQRAAEALANAQAAGSDSGAIVSSIGSGDGAGSGAGRLGIEGGGMGDLTGQRPTAQRERETVRVSVNVRGSREQTAGSGSLDASELARLMRRFERDITRCYERGLGSNPNLRGRVVIEFRIEGNGSVGDARLPDNEVGTEVGNCITGAMRRWRFPAPDGGSVMVRKAYILEPGG